MRRSRFGEDQIGDRPQPAVGISAQGGLCRADRRYRGRSLAGDAREHLTVRLALYGHQAAGQRRGLGSWGRVPSRSSVATDLLRDGIRAAIARGRPGSDLAASRSIRGSSSTFSSSLRKRAGPSSQASALLRAIGATMTSAAPVTARMPGKDAPVALTNPCVNRSHRFFKYSLA